MENSNPLAPEVRPLKTPAPKLIETTPQLTFIILRLEFILFSLCLMKQVLFPEACIEFLILSDPSKDSLLLLLDCVK